MNLNKTLLHITRNCPRFPHSLVPSKLVFGNSLFSTAKSWRTFHRTLSAQQNLQRCIFYSRKIHFCLYSSAANEEQVVRKYSDSVINFQPLSFEDTEYDQPVSHSDLCNGLQICNSVGDQMMALTSTLSLSSEDVEKRIKFSKVLEGFLRPFFGDIKIQIFGSTVNGFGFKGCDIDMSFETSVERKEISYLECPDVPLVSEVLCGRVTPEDISLLPRKEQLLFIHTVLLEFYNESVEPTIFISAHVPLVRFYHDKFNLKCDLSCRNKVAFANTKLLYLFGRLDERVIPMMMTIRYWAKHVELIGKGLLFNTYTMSLLVIHFLQTRNPPILPSAEHILSISDSLEIDDMSDTTFLEIKKSIPPSENTKSLTDLLRDFFFFYSYFDFTRVICPLIGGSVPREKFFSNLPNRKFKMNTICVQDPMLFSHNVADLVDYKSCKKLFREMMVACQKLQENSNLSPSSSIWGLLSLLDYSEEKSSSYLTLQKNVLLSIPLLKHCIISNFANEDRNIITAQTLLYLLENILLFECKTLEKAGVIKLLEKHDKIVETQRKIIESVNQKQSELAEFTRGYRKKVKHQESLDKPYVPDIPMLEEFKNFNSEHSLIFSAECNVFKNTWLGRDSVSVESLPLNSTNDLIEKERYISMHAARQNELNSLDGKTKSFAFFLECYLLPKESESTLLINFRPFQRTNFNPILGIFLKEYIPKLVKDLNRIC